MLVVLSEFFFGLVLVLCGLCLDFGLLVSVCCVIVVVIGMGGVLFVVCLCFSV